MALVKAYPVALGVARQICGASEAADAVQAAAVNVWRLRIYLTGDPAAYFVQDAKWRAVAVVRGERRRPLIVNHDVLVALDEERRLSPRPRGGCVPPKLASVIEAR